MITRSCVTSFHVQSDDLAPKKYKDSGLFSPPKRRVEKPVVLVNEGGLNDKDIEQERPPFARTQAFIPPKFPDKLR
jgi:hypothetical protein